MSGPILVQKMIHYPGYKRRVRFTVRGGLNKIGNQPPYFSITGGIEVLSFGCWRTIVGGCLRDEIEKHFPCHFSNLIALHLSDINGKPMHAVDNGYYWLAGTFPNGLGETYHGGNSKQIFPCTPPTDKPWRTTECRNPTPDECLDIFTKHLRVSWAEAQSYRDVVAAAVNKRGTLAQIVNRLAPRWKAEADACIAKYDLKIFS